MDVVIPFHRRAEHLDEMLASLVGQTYPAWRGILVDDGSPESDALHAAVRRAADQRLAVVRHERNRGIAAARNTGIRAGSAELVAVVDADDTLDPTFLARLVEAFVEDERLDYAIPRMRCFGAWDGLAPAEPLTAENVLARDLPPAGKMMRRRLWERVGGYDEDDAVRLNHEGWGFHIRAFTGGCSARYLPAALYGWRLRPEVTDRRLRDHVVRRAVYARNRAIFDARGAGRRFLRAGYDEAADASLVVGRRWRALALALRACWLEPGRDTLRFALRVAVTGRRRAYSQSSTDGTASGRASRSSS